MRKILCFLTFIFILSTSLLAQQVEVSGKVLDENDNGLPGVNVVIKGTTTGTITDNDGNYNITVPDAKSILQFSFVGYVTEEASVENQTRIDINLLPDIASLEEVVVIGYGQVRKEDLTGSISTLGEKDFNQGVTTSPQELLLGRIAGVVVTSYDGQPGAGNVIRIRGGSSLGGATNDPLVVIDGFPVDDGSPRGISNPLNTLNPNDIESFTVLKDASAAAIYGSRASNGVIIITTKKGSEGKLKVGFNTDFTISAPIEFVEVLNGDEYRALINERLAEGAAGLDASIVSRLGDENTDWQDLIYRNGMSTNNNLTVSGSIKSVPFRLSYGYNNEQGIVETTKASRHSLSLNVNPSLLDDHLKIDLNAKGTAAHSEFGAASNIAAHVQGAIAHAVSFDPTQPVYNGNTTYKGYFQWTETNLPDGSMDPEGIATTFISNPLAQLKLRDNAGDVNRFIGNMHLEYKLHFLPDLKAHLNLGIDKSESEGHNNWLPGATYTIRDFGDANGSINEYTGNTSSELLDVYLNYTKEVGISNFNVTVGYSWQHFRRGRTDFNRNTAGTIVNLDTRYYKESAAAIDSVETDNPTENFLISTYGRLIYTLKDRYILTATLRQDGTSRFVGDNQFGLFPSVAAAWKINEESFLAGNVIISELKLRVGYGVTGQQGLDPNNSNVSDAYYPAIAKYGLGTGYSYYPIGPGGSLVRIRRPEPYDANLKWEETTTYNIGLDFGLWKNKLSGTVDLYKRETKDLLNLVPLADGSNFGNYILTNVGDMDIKGYEVTLTYRPLSTRDLNWTISANLTYNEREIKKLYQTDNPTSAGVETGNQVSGGGLGTLVQIHSIGHEPNAFFTFQQVFDENGDPIEGVYVDRTGEGGVITNNIFNRYHNHSPEPDYMMGIHSRLTYKNLDFSFSGRISLGNYNYNNLQAFPLQGLYSNDIFFVNVPKKALDIGFEYAQPYSDIYVQNASFFKMDNISAGYTFKNVVKEFSPRLAFTVINAFMITNYEGLDPEVQGGVDNNQYPRSRKFMLSLGFNF
ncbi:MAG: SusC/RagA family TonB-linked outer membrane protein [Bacteroidales bacterium]|nr:SusC/RagA family TonB-linked outer membrane protein [Bacteroidales bacterium]